MECVINVSFKRNGPEREAAHRCIAEAQQAYLQAGFTPYRTHIALMSQMVDPDETFWRLAHDIKHVFDPQGILAPGRYDSSWSQACVS
jgi:4-cresol dehydrogenase (hydroxylating)